jgi:hypothetical protein
VIEPVRSALLSSDEVRALQGAAAAIQAWPAGSHVWGHYAEQTENGPAICRTENVSACDPTVSVLVKGLLAEVAEAALGEPAIAFKDKMNYKQPGGAGFSPHQDVVAYPGVLAEGADSALDTDDRGAVRADLVAALTFRPAELRAGDAVCIDGFAPHYSEANRSPHARRVLVASYAPVSEGYSRAQYYETRRAVMDDASARDGRFRISTLADFEGDEVTPDEIAADSCTHAVATAPGGSPSTRPATL